MFASNLLACAPMSAAKSCAAGIGQRRLPFGDDGISTGDRYESVRRAKHATSTRARESRGTGAGAST